jgi:hypothetical protein
MSLTPGAAPGEEPAATAPMEKRRGRIRRLWLVCFALFTFEIGMFLLVFPWMDSWSLNHVPSFLPAVRTEFQDLWDDPYFKGAVSGLGLLNLYIAFRQVISILRNGRQSTLFQ